MTPPLHHLLVHTHDVQSDGCTLLGCLARSLSHLRCSKQQPPPTSRGLDHKLQLTSGVGAKSNTLGRSNEARAVRQPQSN